MIWFLILSPFLAIAQGKGVTFEHGLTWQEVLQKAKQENKYIFVDCYATWCGPCKWMDKNIYPVDSVGTLMNGKFISVRVQMDTVKQDNSETRQWYPIAHSFEEKYHVWSYPGFLFFSPDGQAIHKGVGEKDINGFLSMAEAALDPQQQYYTLLADYRKGILIDRLMPVLANEAGVLGQDSISTEVSRHYIHHYLETQPEAQLWTKDNIVFIQTYSSVVNIGYKIFQLFYQNRATIDSVMQNEHFSADLINNIIYRDEVKSRVDFAVLANAEPNWHQLEKAISKQYTEVYAKKNVLRGRVEYYKLTKKWSKYTKYLIEEKEINGIEHVQPGQAAFVDLNNCAFEVFEYSRNRKELEKALSWVNQSINMMARPFPEEMDTKANLLYKLGRKAEGLSLEEKSVSLAPGDKEIAANYEKMKHGLPTWPAE